MKHYQFYCAHCDRLTIICGNCGNNMCNGGACCLDCEDAYQIDLKNQHHQCELITFDKVELLQKQFLDKVNK